MKPLPFNEGTVFKAIRAVTQVTGISHEQILSRCRTEPVAYARQLAMALLRKRTRRENGSLPSYPEIGRAFQRDHGTALHAVRVVRERVGFDPGWRARYRQALRQFEA